ncbi:hypothetical protein GJV26_06970 [Massilia dura]|uniref:PEP-CTERM sorting domain-containing protein n=1 Tax=Pseudoduganella dura TaxID=321982 RepID=A0A6I3X5Q7_9BURK|nr:hypothetical protein [Pseudoduganella dura]MUI12219.1 hypothetical protein [Pseudoduganella dura]GGY06087.1 hypothetical protein GCM10007386_40950 [Pseudoduganella dura]
MKPSFLHALPLLAAAAPVRAALPDGAAAEPGALVVVLACVVLLCLMGKGRRDGPFRPEP